MNRREITSKIADAFSGFDICPRMVTELIEIISGTGIEKKVLKLLLIRLKLLSIYGAEAITFREFERINETVYSMHLSQTGFNIRILYSFFDNGKPTLLLCFYERSGKRSTDYSTYLPVAAARFRERVEEHSNEP